MWLIQCKRRLKIKHFLVGGVSLNKTEHIQSIHKSNYLIAPNETHAQPDWKIPCPTSACAVPRLMSFSFTQQIVRDSILLIVSVRQFWNSLSIVTMLLCQSLCLTLRFWELNRPHPLLSLLRWHWTLFPLPADSCCSFLYQGEAGQDFSVAADSPQIRLHIPNHEIAWFYSYTRLLSHGL